MNLNRILVLSFLVLVISTYQTDSGIIIGLLLKVLLLKGALFMSMPLTIGSFMMGQGMGFFAGNMLGGMVMLRTANKYHTKEKSKWMGYGEGAHRPSYNRPVPKGWGYNPSFKHQSSYDKGKEIASAFYNLKAHKLKIKSLVTQIKATLTSPKHHGWGSGGSYLGHSSSYKPTGAAYQFSKAPAYQKSKGWGWGSSDSAGGHKPSGYSGGRNIYHGSQIKPAPVPTKNTHLPYHKYKGLTSDKGYDYGGSLSPFKGSYKSQNGWINKGRKTPHNYFLSGYNPKNAKEASPQESASTYYNSVYGRPGHDYSGILTDNQLNSQLPDAPLDKSSKESGFLVNNVKFHPLSPETKKSPTLSPNLLLETYLEKRLEEEAEKQKDVEQKAEAQQLIQMLRKTYLQQLVASLKEEDTLGSSSTEFNRDARSIEDSGIENLSILRNIQMTQSSEAKMYDRSSDSVNKLMLEIPPAPSTSSEIPVISSSKRHIISSSEKHDPIINENLTSSTVKPFSSSENDVNQTDNYVPSPETYLSSTENPITGFQSQPDKNSSVQAIIIKTEPPRELEIPAMWVKTDNTFSKEGSPFTFRVKRNAAEEGEGDEALYDETETQAKGDTSTQPTMPVETEKQIHAFVDDIKKFFTLLTVLDQDQCLQKLVCDVHTNQKDLSKITQYEQNILTTFKLMKALMPTGEEDSSTKYRRAAHIGEMRQSLELCQQTFSSCGYSSSQIITLGTQIEATPTDWAGAGVPSPQLTSWRSDYVSLMPRVGRKLPSYYL